MEDVELRVAGTVSSGFVLIALAANLVIALAKFAASAWTGSSAMLAEAIHSMVDACSQALVLVGLKRSRRPADQARASGAGKELYFYSFVVGVLLFSMAAGVSIYEGAHRFVEPHPIADPKLNYIVLVVAIVLQSISTFTVLSEFSARQRGTGLLQSLRQAKDAALFTVVLEALAALIGLGIAFVGILASHTLGLYWADGAASIAIGLLLALIAVFMSIEIRSVLVGEAVSEGVQEGQPEETGEAAGVAGQSDAREVRDIDQDSDEEHASADAPHMARKAKKSRRRPH